MNIKQAQNYCDHISTCYLTMTGRLIDSLNHAKDLNGPLYKRIMKNPKVCKAVSDIHDELEIHHDELKHLFANDTPQPYLDYIKRNKAKMKELGRTRDFVKRETQKWRIMSMTRLKIKLVIGIVVLVAIVGYSLLTK